MKLTTSRRIKQIKSIKNLKELSERTGYSPTQLDYMFNNKPIKFDDLLYKEARKKIRESLGINEEEMK